jgi:hypothetical protein
VERSSSECASCVTARAHPPESAGSAPCPFSCTKASTCPLSSRVPLWRGRHVEQAFGHSLLLRPPRRIVRDDHLVTNGSARRVLGNARALLRPIPSITLTRFVFIPVSATNTGVSESTTPCVRTRHDRAVQKPPKMTPLGIDLSTLNVGMPERSQNPFYSTSFRAQSRNLPKPCHLLLGGSSTLLGTTCLGF